MRSALEMGLTQSDFEGLIGPIILTEFEGRTLNPMSVQELKEALGPEATNLTITYAANGNQILHVGDKIIEIGPMASTDEIRAAIQNPTIPTANTKMSISGYEPGSIRAKLEALKTAGKNRRDAALGKLDEAGSKHEAVSAEIEVIAKAIEKEADDALAEFAQFTNGGPA